MEGVIVADPSPIVVLDTNNNNSNSNNNNDNNNNNSNNNKNNNNVIGNKRSTDREEKCEKYSLRPRACTKRDEGDEGDFECWKPRSKSKRRPKQKPAPLSKYRRKTANARERCRMREINEGFEALRKVLPHLSSTATTNSSNNEKLTKISTLKLAMKYITALNKILQEPFNGSALQSHDIESDVESFLSSEYTLTPPPDMNEQAFTSPATFSDLSNDFSDQLLSPEDFSSSDVSSINTSTCDISLVSANDLVSSNCCFGGGISDFVNDSFACCSLPEITFDDSAYMLDDADYVTSFT